MLTTLLNPRIESHQQQDLYRRRKVRNSAQNINSNCDSQAVISFCSNNYLGLADHSKIITAMKLGIDKYGVGSGASHLISGYSLAHQQFEEAFADFVGRQRALLFSTGFQANIGTISALLNIKDVIFQDKLNHASLLDAALLSQAKTIRYPHLATKNLLNKLLASKVKKNLIATESIFSMNGDIAPLPELVKISKQTQSILLVDDAHATGVIGKTGAGSLEHFALTQTDVPILISTLGKAFGCFGAVVSGSNELIEYLIQFARSYIYTTAIPPSLACAALASLEIVQTENWRREKLNYLINYFKKAAAQRNLQLLPSDSAIQSFVLGTNQNALYCSEKLFQRGFWVTAIRPPTVPPNTARLRISLTCLHEEQQIDALLNNLAEIYAEISGKLS